MKSLFKVTLLAATMAVALNAPLTFAADTATKAAPAAESKSAFKKVHRGFPGKAALIFRKKYSESLNPYAIRFITLILLFTPSSTLVCIG